MKVTNFLRIVIGVARQMGREEPDPAKCRELHRIADTYNRMLEAFFAKGDKHKDLPGKTIGRAKRAIKTIPEDEMEVKLREILDDFVSNKISENPQISLTEVGGSVD